MMLPSGSFRQERYLKDWMQKVVDTDNTFLNGDLDHETFMKIPEGYKDCIQDYDEDKLKEAGFTPSIVDPCLLQCKDDRGVSILIMYVDDLLITGKPETNENTIDDLKQYLELKKATTPDDYLSVQVIKSVRPEKSMVRSTNNIDALMKKFGKEVEKQRISLTQGTPGFIGVKQNEEGA